MNRDGDNMQAYRNVNGAAYPGWCKGQPDEWFSKLLPHRTPKQITVMKAEQDALSLERARRYGHIHHYRNEP